MSKVEKNGSVEVKVVKTEDEGGEFHTQQVGIFICTCKLHQLGKDSVTLLYIFRAIRRRSSKEEGVATILLGTKSTKRTEEGLARVSPQDLKYPLTTGTALLVTRNLNVRAAEVRAKGEGRGKGGRRRSPGGHLLVFPNSELKHRSRNASAAGRGRGVGSRGALSNRAAKQQARLAKLARNYEVRLSYT